jgi:hypothetical protein
MKLFDRLSIFQSAGCAHRSVTGFAARCLLCSRLFAGVTEKISAFSVSRLVRGGFFFFSPQICCLLCLLFYFFLSFEAEMFDTAASPVTGGPAGMGSGATTTTPTSHLVVSTAVALLSLAVCTTRQADIYASLAYHGLPNHTAVAVADAIVILAVYPIAALLYARYYYGTPTNAMNPWLVSNSAFSRALRSSSSASGGATTSGASSPTASGSGGGSSAVGSVPVFFRAALAALYVAGVFVGYRADLESSVDLYVMSTLVCSVLFAAFFDVLVYVIAPLVFIGGARTYGGWATYCAAADAVTSSGTFDSADGGATSSNGPGSSGGGNINSGGASLEMERLGFPAVSSRATLPVSTSSAHLGVTLRAAAGSSAAPTPVTMGLLGPVVVSTGPNVPAPGSGGSSSVPPVPLSAPLGGASGAAVAAPGGGPSTATAATAATRHSFSVRSLLARPGRSPVTTIIALIVASVLAAFAALNNGSEWVHPGKTLGIGAASIMGMLLVVSRHVQEQYAVRPVQLLVAFQPFVIPLGLIVVYLQEWDLTVSVEKCPRLFLLLLCSGVAAAGRLVALFVLVRLTSPAVAAYWGCLILPVLVRWQQLESYVTQTQQLALGVSVLAALAFSAFTFKRQSGPPLLLQPLQQPLRSS